MAIGILDNSLTDQVLSLLVDHPLVEEIEANDDGFMIQCNDLSSLVEWMESEHGLYLIAGRDGWRFASVIDEAINADEAIEQIEDMDDSEIEQDVEETDVEEGGDQEMSTAIEHAKTSAISKAKDAGVDLKSDQGKDILRMLMKKELEQ